MRKREFIEVWGRHWGIFATVLLSLLLLVLGVVYYGMFRSPEFRPSLFLPMPNYRASWRDLTFGSLPSLVHALSLFLLLGLFMRLNHSSQRQVRFWLCISVAVLLTIEFAFGTYQLLDVIVTFFALPIAFAIVKQLPDTTQVKKQFSRWFPAVSLVVFSWMAIATSQIDEPGPCRSFDDNGFCIEDNFAASPVYMSYAELRAAVRSETPRPLDSIGRIYAYGTTLFINERNLGIHVYDNSDPFAPKAVAFINIPGNLDIEVRNDNLYADSFIDLVTIDVSDPTAITVLDRVESVFPYDAEQALPSNVNLRDGTVDQSLGVVISYERSFK